MATHRISSTDALSSALQCLWTSALAAFGGFLTWTCAGAAEAELNAKAQKELDEWIIHDEFWVEEALLYSTRYILLFYGEFPLQFIKEEKYRLAALLWRWVWRLSEVLWALYWFSMQIAHWPLFANEHYPYGWATDMKRRSEWTPNDHQAVLPQWQSYHDCFNVESFPWNCQTWEKGYESCASGPLANTTCGSDQCDELKYNGCIWFPLSEGYNTVFALLGPISMLAIHIYQTRLLRSIERRCALAQGGGGAARRRDAARGRTASQLIRDLEDFGRLERVEMALNAAVDSAAARPSPQHVEALSPLLSSAAPAERDGEDARAAAAATAVARAPVGDAAVRRHAEDDGDEDCERVVAMVAVHARQRRARFMRRVSRAIAAFLLLWTSAMFATGVYEGVVISGAPFLFTMGASPQIQYNGRSSYGTELSNALLCATFAWTRGRPLAFWCTLR